MGERYSYFTRRSLNSVYFRLEKIQGKRPFRSNFRWLKFFFFWLPGWLVGERCANSIYCSDVVHLFSLSTHLRALSAANRVKDTRAFAINLSWQKWFFFSYLFFSLFFVWFGWKWFQRSLFRLSSLCYGWPSERRGQKKRVKMKNREKRFSIVICIAYCYKSSIRVGKFSMIKSGPFCEWLIRIFDLLTCRNENRSLLERGTNVTSIRRDLISCWEKAEHA